MSRARYPVRTQHPSGRTRRPAACGSSYNKVGRNKKKVQYESESRQPAQAFLSHHSDDAKGDPAQKHPKGTQPNSFRNVISLWMNAKPKRLKSHS